MNYTPAQVRLYIEAAGRAEKRRQRDTLWLLRASRADDKGFNEAIKALDE